VYRSHAQTVQVGQYTSLAFTHCPTLPCRRRWCRAKEQASCVAILFCGVACSIGLYDTDKNNKVDTHFAALPPLLHLIPESCHPNRGRPRRLRQRGRCRRHLHLVWGQKPLPGINVRKSNSFSRRVQCVVCVAELCA